MSNKYSLTLKVTSTKFLAFIESFGTGFFNKPVDLQHNAKQYQSLVGSYMTWYPSTGKLTCYGKRMDRERLFAIVEDKYNLFIQSIIDSK